MIHFPMARCGTRTLLSCTLAALLLGCGRPTEDPVVAGYVVEDLRVFATPSKGKGGAGLPSETRPDADPLPPIREQAERATDEFLGGPFAAVEEGAVGASVSLVLYRSGTCRLFLHGLGGGVFFRGSWVSGDNAIVVRSWEDDSPTPDRFCPRTLTRVGTGLEGVLRDGRGPVRWRLAPTAGGR